MSILIADEQLAARLEQADAPLEICTRDGRRLGFFTPAKPAQHRLEPQISEEELQRREQDTQSPGFTLDEMLARLRAQ